MAFIPKNKILEYRPDTIQVVRRQYDLDKPGRMQEAVIILNEWVQKQTHFKKKDFTLHYLEATIILCKGSLERAKSQLDKSCTIRTLLPQFFGDYNVRTDFEKTNNNICAIALPKLTEDHQRVFLSKGTSAPENASEIMDFFKGNIILAEYLKNHDYLNGFILVLDFAEVNFKQLITTLNPTDLRHAISIYIEGYQMKIKSIYLISFSKFLDAFLTIFKQVLSPKVASRIHILKSKDELQNVISKSILPKDYGGEERSVKELQEEWLNILSSEEHRNYIREMNTAVTDESLRPRDKFSEQYAGLPGTFRFLNVD